MTGQRAHRPAVAPDVYAIGDVQGCFDCLQALLARIDAEHSRGPTQAAEAARAERTHASPDRTARTEFSPARAARTDDSPDRAERLERAPGMPPVAARLWLCGDLVNRGPKSLETLRWAMANEHRIVTVLGNHDLHLLAVAAGIRPEHRSDTLRAILEAPDREALIDWLRRRPLAHLENGMLLVHAGLLPQWTAARAVALAAEVQSVLSGPDWTGFLRVMYGNHPDLWNDRLEGGDRLRVIVNALTRLRFCTPDGRMEFSTKEGAGGAPPGHLPWFDAPGRASADTTVIFGHWSTLGLLNRPRLLGMDTGCVWGGRLTAIRLGDRRMIDVGCPQAQAPGGG